MSLLNSFCIFILYSFFWWCVEVLYAFFAEKKFVNRWLLKWPFCPIYGFSVLLAILAEPVINSFSINNITKFLFIFLYSAVITTIIEYITAYLLETYLHKKLWDYSKFKFNYKWYICLWFSLTWWLLISFTLFLINPSVIKMFKFIPENILEIFTYWFVLYFLIDFILAIKKSLYEKAIKLMQNL